MNDAEKLADLRNHWGSAYVIEWTGRLWLAWWRADLTSDVLRAHTAAELREMIRHDYHVRTVPTEVSASPRS